MPRWFVWFARIVLALLGVLAALALWAYWPESAAGEVAGLERAGDPYDAEIVRDAYGVPHIFGRTDPDVAYGLAYAHAEDDFLTIQQSIIAARGTLAATYGKEAAANDYMVQLLRVWDTVDARYDTDVSPEMRAIVEAYAAGLNHYAALHPDEALVGLFPVEGKDIVATSVHKSPLFFGLEKTLIALFGDERPTFETAFAETRFGSNVLAVGPGRSADGHTMFVSNSHQPWEGPVAWYEASVHSDEGWEFTGALFPAMPVHALGTNGDLAWSFTVNHPDLVDVYLLDVDPEDPYRYRVDGEWLEMERRPAPITVKLAGRFRWTVTEEVLWSIYGPVLRRPHGTYAIRYAGMDSVGIFDQLYAMAKARSFDDWTAPLRSQDGLPTFNVGYADRNGTIYYAYNAMLPLRDAAFDWSGIVPGDTMATRWTGYLPFDELPSVVDPPAGFIVNANSTPWQTTIGAGNPDPRDYPDSFGIEDYPTNRSLRALQLLAADDPITFGELVDIKFDATYDERSLPVRWARRLAEADPARLVTGREVPVAAIERSQELLRSWDRTADVADEATALVVATLSFVFDAVDNSPGVDFEPSRLTDTSVGDDVVDSAFVDAVEWLARRRNDLSPRWGDVNRLRRGEVDLPLAGGPDLLRAVYGERQDDGTLTGIAGDSYILFVDWDPQGRPTAQSIHQFGSATLRPASPHYADQAPLFASEEMKPTWISAEEVRAHAAVTYAPGEGDHGLPSPP